MKDPIRDQIDLALISPETYFPDKELSGVDFGDRVRQSIILDEQELGFETQSLGE